jgi:hypothetical protein
MTLLHPDSMSFTVTFDNEHIMYDYFGESVRDLLEDVLDSWSQKGVGATISVSIPKYDLFKQYRYKHNYGYDCFGEPLRDDFEELIMKYESPFTIDVEANKLSVM